MFNKQEYVDLGRLCAGVCKALDRGSKGRRLDEVSPLALEAIEELTTWVEPVLWPSRVLLTEFSMQNCGHNPEGDCQAGQTKHSLSGSSRKERQR
jgi:hypothetical protein